MAFARLNQDWNLFLLDASAPNELGVAPLVEQPGDDRDPAWSPDGQLVAFDSNRSGTRQIYVISRTGRGERQLTSGQADSFAPAWSPDGRLIAFVSETDGGTDIYTYDMETGDIDQIIKSPGKDESPAWMDAESLLFVSDRDGNDEIYVSNLLTRTVERITELSSQENDPLSCRFGDGISRICFSSYTGSWNILHVLGAQDSPVLFNSGRALTLPSRSK